MQQRENIRLSSATIKEKLRLRLKKNLHSISYYYSRTGKNLKKFTWYSQVLPETATAFEIGSGNHLIAPIGLSLLGFKKIITVDIERFANAENIQTVLKFYRKNMARLGIHHYPKLKGKITDENLDKYLQENFNVDYRAPYDASHTDLPDNSVDYVFANSVFEHINADILPDIVKESFRILKKGGVLYTNIDFKDHRSFMRSKLTIYDYLQYSSDEWLKIDKKQNQNRLRLPDHLAAFAAAGFEVLEIKKMKITDEDRAAFATVKVHEEFKKKYSEDELLEKNASIVLRKPFDKLPAEN